MEAGDASADVEPQAPAPAHPPVSSRRRDARSPPRGEPVSKCRSRGRGSCHGELRGRRREPGAAGRPLLPPGPPSHPHRVRPLGSARAAEPLAPPRGCRRAPGLTLRQTQSPSLPGSARLGSPCHAAARRPTTHLRPRVSHFSDGLTDSTAAPAGPAAAAVAAAPAAAAAAATTCLPAQHRFAPP
ncbi:uncharacterized protein LOC144317323 [Canis aureus]